MAVFFGVFASLTNVRHRDTIASNFKEEATMMYGTYSNTNTSNHCATFAAASSCAHIRAIVDTALLAVSVLLLSLVRIILFGV